jgi:hypothetical protein
VKAFACPPMNRLFYLPRAATLAALVKAYPKESEKDIKAREKQEAEHRISLRESLQSSQANSLLRNLKKETLIVRGMWIAKYSMYY